MGLVYTEFQVNGTQADFLDTVFNVIEEWFSVDGGDDPARIRIRPLTLPKLGELNVYSPMIRQDYGSCVRSQRIGLVFPMGDKRRLFLLSLTRPRL